LRAILIGVLSAFFFTFTFVLNRAMDLEGGNWIWSASLRYFFMVPFLLAIVWYRGNLAPLLREMRTYPREWLLWSFVGFGLFYAPLCFAAAYGPGWLIAGTWQITIIAGSLLVPFFYREEMSEAGPRLVRQQIPVKGLMMSLVILAGVALMQVEHAGNLTWKEMVLGLLPVLLAAFAYPLGNRKMMELTKGRIDAYQRLLGMTLASMPFWLLLALIGLLTDGAPGWSQTGQSLVVAISSGVIATALFFHATDLARGNVQQLAAVEATQSAEVVFAVFLEMLVLSAAMPSAVSFAGIVTVMAGMILHSYVSRLDAGAKKKESSVSA